jgi:hypothetical protein
MVEFHVSLKIVTSSQILSYSLYILDIEMLLNGRYKKGHWFKSCDGPIPHTKNPAKCLKRFKVLKKLLNNNMPTM